jgi:hypothetical protein
MLNYLDQREGLFALRAHPSGRPSGRSSPLRDVVEPSCFLSAVRILTSNYGLPKIGFWAKKKLAPRDGTEISDKTPRIPAFLDSDIVGYPQKYPR